MLIHSKRSRRKTDPFSLLLVVVTFGMFVTLSYQVMIYYGSINIPIANQTPASSGVGG